MTMALSSRQLPPELEAAIQTLRNAIGQALPTRKARMSRLSLYMWMLALGTIAAALAVYSGVVSPNDKDFWRSGLTALSVLSGFMVTTMVFSGKIEAAKSLSLSELREVSAKANHLLLSQIGTLTNHVICLALMLLVPSVSASLPISGSALATGTLGLFFVSLMRSVFIPLQIVELHRFTHAALLREKRESEKTDTEKL